MALGLSTGVYCFASCVPVLLPYLLSEGGKKVKTNVLILAQFLLGRFIAYLLFAFLAIFASRNLADGLPKWTAPAILISCGLLLLSHFIKPGSTASALCCLPKIKTRMPFLLGFLLGIKVCPPFIAALMRLLTIGYYFNGAVFFAGFFAATSLFFVLVLIPTPFLGERLKLVGKMTLFLVGAWYLLMGITALIS